MLVLIPRIGPASFVESRFAWPWLVTQTSDAVSLRGPSIHKTGRLDAGDRSWGHRQDETVSFSDSFDLCICRCISPTYCSSTFLLAVTRRSRSRVVKSGGLMELKREVAGPVAPKRRQTVCGGVRDRPPASMQWRSLCTMAVGGGRCYTAAARRTSGARMLSLSDDLRQGEWAVQRRLWRLQ